MLHLARFLRSRRFRAVLVLSLVAVAFLGVAIDTASGCWNIVVAECFNRPATEWPWISPVGSARRWNVCCVVNGTTYCNPPQIPAQYPRWHITTDYFFDVLMCPDDNRSLWCYGWPVGDDPRYDFYPANFNTYVTYGRVDLSQAASARVLWSMWTRTEELHDSIYWGASKTSTLVDSGMKIGGSRWQDTDDWQPFSMDLDSLHDFLTSAPFSFLGEDTVYIFWRFRSDANTVRNTGTFIDNVTGAWDDGLQDLAAGEFDYVPPDSDNLPGDPRVGDVLMAHFGWTICDGAAENYDPYHVVILQNNVPLLDTLIVGSHGNEHHQIYTPLWTVTAPGDYDLRAVVDTLNQITENNETNNVRTVSYHVDPPNLPPVFTWITPGADTLWADSVAMLRWTVYDPDEQASSSIYYDNEPQWLLRRHCPGGSNRPELDGPDSIAWDVHFLPNLRTMYIFAHVTDAANDTCIYALGRVVINHETAVHERPTSGVPKTYFLDQNFPNPFNPATEIRYGVAVAGQVTLNIFNVLGRNVETLVNSRHEPGNYIISFNGANLPSGVYMYVLTSPEGTIGRKMLLLK